MGFTWLGCSSSANQALVFAAGTGVAVQCRRGLAAWLPDLPLYSHIQKSIYRRKFSLLCCLVYLAGDYGLRDRRQRVIPAGGTGQGARHPPPPWPLGEWPQRREAGGEGGLERYGRAAGRGCPRAIYLLVTD
ncbi:hypothetical protein E2C01_032380 [Portunus trituberculatus]|uniref:Uncharacterized protein n=1 Tax=Portunus trituberculatus TaxID=210409 RepID=A0A5B7F2M3_PORTR|nr:hypothetical protein [Portunus trituberculatus]